jgi:hypothetical protein
MHASRLLIIAFFALSCVTNMKIDAAFQGGVASTFPDGNLVIAPGNAFTFVPPPAGIANTPTTATFIIDDPVGYFSTRPAALVAFQYALSILAKLVTSPVAIHLQAAFVNCSQGDLVGNGGVTQVFRDFSGAPIASTWYPRILAEKLSGTSLGTGSAITFSVCNGVPWYYGTDGATPAGQYDFVTAVMHEVIHGLGFRTGAFAQNGYASLLDASCCPKSPDIFARYFATDAGLPLLAITDPQQLYPFVTTDYNPAAPHGTGTYWLGISGMSANGGISPRMYTPATWLQGGSLFHLDDSVFPAGSSNSLMTHALSAAEAIHSPGPIVMGMLADMGWNNGGAPTPPFPGWDFNGDGQPDLVWENTSGQHYVWYMLGTTMTGGSYLTPDPMDPNLTIGAVQDFSGDGHPDLLMQNKSTGTAVLYYMNGTVKVGEQTLQANPNPWTVVASGDINNDRHPDIVWENFATGQVYVWFMSSSNGQAIFGGPNGTFSGDYLRDESQAVIGLGATTLRVAGAADVNGDGKTDLVVNDPTTGAIRCWTLNGTTRTSDVAINAGFVQPQWVLRSVGESALRGHATLLWESTGGQLYQWHLSGTAFLNGVYLSPQAVNPVWTILGPR